MNLYVITLNSKYCNEHSVSDGNSNPVIVRADSVSVGMSNQGVDDSWVKFYVVNNESAPDKSRSRLVYTVHDQYVVSVRDLGVAPPESQPPPNDEALEETKEFDLKNEPPVGTVLRLTFPAGYLVGASTGRRVESLTEMVLTHRKDGWVSSVDGHVFSWAPKFRGDNCVYLILQTVAKVEVAEFRTVRLHISKSGD